MKKLLMYIASILLDDEHWILKNIEKVISKQNLFKT